MPQRGSGGRVPGRASRRELGQLPGLPDSPYRAWRQRYLPRGAGAVFTFGVKGGREAGARFIEELRLISHLANVGDAKTLIIHPAAPPTSS